MAAIAALLPAGVAGSARARPPRSWPAPDLRRDGRRRRRPGTDAARTHDGRRARWPPPGQPAVATSLGRGSGTVVGGRVGLAVDPSLLAALAGGRPVALVSGHQRQDHHHPAAGGRPRPATAAGPVVTNATGANMPAGHVAALAGGRPPGPAVLEVDEGYLPAG